MRLSFNIPCYNASRTVRRCLDSIYALGLPEEEFEVIVVNDGSTDETGRLVEEYGTAHPNLTLIRHLVNRNLGAARNTGLAVAKGDCIAFVDSDDEVGPGLVSALRMMEEKGLDMVAMPTCRETLPSGRKCLYSEEVEGIPVHKYGTYFSHINNREYWMSLAKKVVYAGSIDEFFDFRFGQFEWGSSR